MDRLKNFGSGYRTYVLMAVLFVAGGLKSLGYIDQGTYDALFAFLVPMGITTLRMAVK